MLLLGLLYIMASRCVDLRQTCVHGGMIAIVFADGPVKDVTSRILEDAEDLGVKLTFYFTVHQKAKGNVGQVYRRAVEDGHTVGLELNPHRDYDSMSPDEIDDDVGRQIETIDRLAGTKIKYGTSKVVDGQVSPELYNAMIHNGVLLTYYEFCPYDEEDPLGEFDNMTRGANPKHDSFIVLMHDAYEGQTPYLKKMVEIGKKNGYSFVNMDECLGGYKAEESGTGEVFKPRSGAESFGKVFLPLLILALQFL